MRRIAIVCLMLACTVLGAAAASPKQNSAVRKAEKQEKKELRRQMREEFQRRQVAGIRESAHRSAFLEKYKLLLSNQSSYMTKATPELLNSVLACYRSIFALVETDEAYGAATPEAVPAAVNRKHTGKSGLANPEPKPYVYDLHVFNISGLHADYGYLLLSSGDEECHDEALRHLRREMELYPESKQLVETIIANYERHENR